MRCRGSGIAGATAFAVYKSAHLEMTFCTFHAAHGSIASPSPEKECMNIREHVNNPSSMHF
jgi:hypothetical protein